MKALNDPTWARAIEKQYRAVLKTEYMTSKTRSTAMRAALETLAKAATHSWDPELAQAVGQSSKDVPADARLYPSDFDEPYGWWWFNTTVNGYAAVSWGFKDNHIMVVGYFLDSRGDPSPASTLMIKMGETVEGFVRAVTAVDGIMHKVNLDGEEEPVDQGSKDRAMALVKLFAAGTVWTRQKIAVADSVNMKFMISKRAAQAVLSTEVKIIRLRRTETRPHDRRDGSAEVEWSCRWIVRGHWKNQYHPSTGEHELIFIKPYPKGPDDKPLKVPTHTVYSVDR